MRWAICRTWWKASGRVGETRGLFSSTAWCVDRNASPGSAHSALLALEKKRPSSIGTSLSFLLMPLHLLQHFQACGGWKLAVDYWVVGPQGRIKKSCFFCTSKCGLSLAPPPLLQSERMESGVTSDGITGDTTEQISSRKWCERCFYTETERNPLNKINYRLPG